MTFFNDLSTFSVPPSDANSRVRCAWPAQARCARVRGGRRSSVGLLGSAAFYPYLSNSERRRALDTALGKAEPAPILVDMGSLRTDRTVRLADEAKRVEALAGLPSPVSYTLLTDFGVQTLRGRGAGEQLVGPHRRQSGHDAFPVRLGASRPPESSSPAAP